MTHVHFWMNSYEAERSGWHCGPLHKNYQWKQQEPDSKRKEDFLTKLKYRNPTTYLDLPGHPRECEWRVRRTEMPKKVAFPNAQNRRMARIKNLYKRYRPSKLREWVCVWMVEDALQALILCRKIILPYEAILMVFGNLNLKLPGVRKIHSLR